MGLTAQPVLDTAPTTNKRLLDWVAEVAELTQPESIYWVDGSEAENTRLTDELVAAGTLTRLNPELFPNSFAGFSDPKDVARVEEQTFICSEKEHDAGFTNNWMEPAEMRTKLSGLFKGSMRGRTMYVIPFVMGHLDAKSPKFGVEITDSAYVVASMRIMARIGTEVLRKIEEPDAFFVPAIHSLGAPLEPGQADVPWPCNDEKWIVHFPESREIWSYGSGYGGNALLGKKCYALRIASVMAHDEGWLAEHMLILKLTSPEQKTYYMAAAFPSACGKTNLALLDPTIKGWKVETLGDDITWMNFDDEGALRAVNPEAGLFGVAPGTGWDTNPNAMRAIAKGNSIFTNVALTDDGGVWWEGMTTETPSHLTDWRGNSWTPDSAEPAAHPNSRFCTPIDQIDMLAPEYNEPDGVPLSAILFGGRRKTTIPLVTQSRDWTNGIFMGSTLSSETTAAAAGAVGVVRRDPMAMLPFIGYDAGDYLKHWVELSKQGDQEKLPKIFLVNWFRRTADGGFAWPGFGDNSRVVTWAIERIEGKADAVETPIGFVPTKESLDLDGLDISDEQLSAALNVDALEWAAEAESIDEWYRRFGGSLPEELLGELEGLKERLG
ncbi:phosphoenolpyruvate carboxykinase (GTP) [Renibacterium salmoninarum ATCC 33209]|uniref:Phosphoenolpyruvate carboxykinase [GTP] n=1 Tax=Renibacterium salmoninarum (strain ATCC 33209 / DSM 20767 / JCM 11484 / NBRC 15589 / NCIMB 2235) TaxID=288705 RepID=PCKG_RENSM|nr:phosphoenolpyruvate carboxykinase (GTP) [Renibacterium salmoninarum]A9WL73.1 RecName: Full=Phosphoenolpyruvate carboxykinase [GTP]; Short=PEP carboxykinase; Short=PEPCK [Renibacterium salmoninarum ATCC 33209]ABY21787.1 phosphoenolpyruvate carboxykinase (GTP) [Renibacterium salmoninarum ATCC 33209]